MSETLTYRSMQESDWPAVTRLIVHAFAGTPEGTQDWLKFAGPEHVRVVQGETNGRSAGRACLLRVPMGQFFGGRSVPMLGIAGVGVAPEVRGRGVAKFMMQEAVREGAR